MSATSNDILKLGRKLETIKIDSLEIDVRPLTVTEALDFSKYSQAQSDKLLVSAYLIKTCCPAFNFVWWNPSRWWTAKRIKNKMPVMTLLNISNEILRVNGYSDSSVNDAVKS